jgi:hypothetical protein
VRTSLRISVQLHDRVLSTEDANDRCDVRQDRTHISSGYARSALGQFQGRSSWIRLAGWSGKRARTSASHAWGSTSLSLAVSIVDGCGTPAALVRNGALFWRTEDHQLIGVSQAILGELITANVVTRKLVNKGTEAEPDWILEFAPLRLTGPALRTLLSPGTLRDGSLIPRIGMA